MEQLSVVKYEEQYQPLDFSFKEINKKRRLENENHLMRRKWVGDSFGSRHEATK